MKKESSQDTSLYIIGWCCIVAACVYLFAKVVVRFDIFDYARGCTLHTWTGLYCLGCGGTRAVFALLRGEFLHSLYLHPFVPYAAVVGGWFMISQTIERLSHGKIKIALHFRMVYVWIAIAIILINCIWKNAVLLVTGVPLI